MGIGQPASDQNHIRKFHLPHAHLNSLFGDDWFGTKAEDFARFFGTPTFLGGADGHRRGVDLGQRAWAGPSSTSIPSSCSTWLSSFRPPMPRR